MFIQEILNKEMESLWDKDMEYFCVSCLNEFDMQRVYDKIVSGYMVNCKENNTIISDIDEDGFISCLKCMFECMISLFKMAFYILLGSLFGDGLWVSGRILFGGHYKIWFFECIGMLLLFNVCFHYIYSYLRKDKPCDHERIIRHIFGWFIYLIFIFGYFALCISHFIGAGYSFQVTIHYGIYAFISILLITSIIFYMRKYFKNKHKYSDLFDFIGIVNWLKYDINDVIAVSKYLDNIHEYKNTIEQLTNNTPIIHDNGTNIWISYANKLRIVINILLGYQIYIMIYLYSIFVTNDKILNNINSWTSIAFGGLCFVYIYGFIWINILFHNVFKIHKYLKYFPLDLKLNSIFVIKQKLQKLLFKYNYCKTSYILIEPTVGFHISMIIFEYIFHS